MSEKPESVIVADGTCPLCGHAAVVKANRKGRLYIYCLTPADGGCGNSSMSRSNVADREYAQKFVTKWRKPEYRIAYLGDASESGPARPSKGRPAEAAPAPAIPEDDPESDDDDQPEPEPEPEAETEAEKKTRLKAERNERHDREING